MEVVPGGRNVHCGTSFSCARLPCRFGSKAALAADLKRQLDSLNTDLLSKEVLKRGGRLDGMVFYLCRPQDDQGTRTF